MKQTRPFFLRSLSALLALVMLLAAVPMNAAAQEPKSGVTPDGICYQICTKEDGSLEVEGEYVVITGISHPMTEVVIPSHIEDIPVLAIGDDAFARSKIERIVLPEGLTTILSHAFENCGELTEIVLPSTLRGMWAFAFAGCSSLKEIVLPEGMTTVFQFAFAGCTGLERVVLPSTLKLIKSYAFNACYSLKEITLPQSLTTIQQNAFDGCTSLTEITLPENLTTLEYDVFSYCEQLKTIHIPASVTEIGDGCFAGCSALTEITVDPGNSVYTSIDGVLFKDQGATLLQYPGGRTGAYTVPASVTAIDNFAFHFCAGLTRIDLPAGLTEIGESAFQGCKALTEVELPEGMTYLSFSAFQTCEGLTRIDLPDSLTRIDGAAFQDCISLTQIDLPAGLKELGGAVFQGCTGLTSIELPKDLESIGSQAFLNCTALTSVDLPDGLTNLPYGLFDGCTALSRIDLPAGLVSIDREAFGNCTSLTEMHIPATVTDIGYGAFMGSTGIREITVDPDNPVYTSVDGILYVDGGTLLHTVPAGFTGVCTINDQVTAFSDFAFTDCPYVTEVVIPAGVTSITDYCFNGCTGLMNIHVANGNSWFTSVDGVLYQDNGTTLARFPGSRSGGFTIPAGVTAIWLSAFQDCENLTSVVIPDGVTTIGGWAFKNCDRLVSVQVADSVTEIGSEVFSNCTSLESFTWPSGSDYIPFGAFEYCTNLREITIPSTVTMIDGPTTDCARLTDIYFEGTEEQWNMISFWGVGSDFQNATVHFWCTPTEPEHSWGSGIVTKEPTCTEDGEKQLICARCGATKTEPAWSVGHAYVTTLVEPTCTEDGYAQVVCSFCGDSNRMEYETALITMFQDALGLPAGSGVFEYNAEYMASRIVLLYVSTDNGDYVTVPAAEFEAKLRAYFVVSDDILSQIRDFSSIADLYGPDLVVYDAGTDTYTLRLTGGFGGWMDERQYVGYVDNGDTYDVYYGKANYQYLVDVLPADVDAWSYWAEHATGDPLSLEYEGMVYHGGPDGPYAILSIEPYGKKGTVELNGEIVRIISVTDYTAEDLPDHFEDSAGKALGHHYMDTVTAPTCTENGYTIHTCDNCGDSYVDTPVDALGHSWDNGVVTKEPTEDAEGEKTYTCSVCGETKTESIPKKEHVHDYTAVVTEATCTEGGYITYTCRCGDSYVADEMVALGHEFGEWMESKKPGCTTEGEEVRGCNRCDHYEIRTIEPKGHSYTPVVTDATCTEGGYTTYYCACGDSYVDDETDALGHDMEAWMESKAPGCTEPGEEIRGCSRCDHTEKREIEATGHDWCDWQVIRAATEEAEGEEQRNCRNCGKYETRPIPKLDHVHDYTAVVTDPTCTEGGYTTYTCACGDSYIADETDALSHEFTHGECIRCGAEDPDYVPENPFTDVKETDYFLDPVLWAVEEGITAGTGAGQFSPNNTCTRAQVVTFLWRAMGKPEPTSTENPFTDVASGDYFYKAVLWAVENGVTSGTGGGKFSPNNPCTRDQVVTFLWRAMGKPTPEKTDNPFTDVAEGAYYYQPVLWAVENGITSGTSATTFAPSNPCTRGQVVTFLYRAMKDK